MRIHPEQDSSHLVAVDIIADGFSLAGVPDASFDFLIANHVLEHTPNPVFALINWSRVLRTAGILYLCLPLATQSFDRGRPITSPEHILEDYQLFRQNVSGIFAKRNRQHLAEWIAISEANILRKQDRHTLRPSADAIQQRVAEADLSATNEPHFHTFSTCSLPDFLRLFIEQIDSSLEIVEVVSNFSEAIAVLAKKSR